MRWKTKNNSSSNQVDIGSCNHCMASVWATHGTIRRTHEHGNGPPGPSPTISWPNLAPWPGPECWPNLVRWPAVWARSRGDSTAGGEPLNYIWAVAGSPASSIFHWSPAAASCAVQWTGHQPPAPPGQHRHGDPALANTEHIMSPMDNWSVTRKITMAQSPDPAYLDVLKVISSYLMMKFVM